MSSDIFWKFNSFNWISWAIVLLFISVLVGSVIIYRLNHKLVLISAMVTKAPTAVGQEVLTHYAQRVIKTLSSNSFPTPDPPTNRFKQMLDTIVRDLRFVDTVSLLMFVLMVGTFVAIFIILRSSSCRTHTSRLYLEVRSGNHAIQ